MKKRCAAVLSAAVLMTAVLGGCAQSVDTTPVWQTDLPNTGVHMELSNAEIVSDGGVMYAHTREDADAQNYQDMSAVQAEGAPVVTFSGVTADEVSLVFLESIGELFVDYDRVNPQIKLDYVLTENADSVSYKLDTAYNFAFTVTTDKGSDTYLVVSKRSDIQQ